MGWWGRFPLVRLPAPRWHRRGEREASFFREEVEVVGEVPLTPCSRTSTA